MNDSDSTTSSEKADIPCWKRGLDITVILLASPVLVFCAALIAAIIRTVSTGPILFKQERVGYRERKFRCLKFRTMYAGVDAATHQGYLNNLISADVPLVKLDAQGDTRIIPLGRLLRSSGLDELPQLINVLRSEMSLVGPRPCLPYESERLQPWQRERFTTVPGLTGLWQVSGKNRTTFSEMMRLDIHYAQNKSLGLDLKILFKTIPVLLIQTWEMRLKKNTEPPVARV